MDIPTLSMQLSTANVAQQVNIAVLKNSIEMTRQTGQQICEMIKNIPHPDSTVDFSV